MNVRVLLAAHRLLYSGIVLTAATAVGGKGKSKGRCTPSFRHRRHHHPQPEFIAAEMSTSVSCLHPPSTSVSCAALLRVEHFSASKKLLQRMERKVALKVVVPNRAAHVGRGEGSLQGGNLCIQTAGIASVIPGGPPVAVHPRTISEGHQSIALSRALSMTAVHLHPLLPGLHSHTKGVLSPLCFAN